MVGSIDSWEPLERRLKIGGRPLGVTSDVSVIGLSQGTRVAVSRHQDHQTARWIVTLLTLDCRRREGAHYG